MLNKVNINSSKALLRHACLVQNHLASPTGGVDFDKELIQHAIIHVWGQVPDKEGVLRAERREESARKISKPCCEFLESFFLPSSF